MVYAKFSAKFISKQELGKGTLVFRLNLRHGGSVLIDRKDPKQAVPAISNSQNLLLIILILLLFFRKVLGAEMGFQSHFKQLG